MLHPFDQSKAMVIGQALHKRVLELDGFALDYIMAPRAEEGVTKTKAGLPSKRDPKGKEAWAAWEARAQGRTVLSPAEWEQIGGMTKSIEAHPFAAELLSASGANEVTVLWDETVEVEDREITVPCKARIDSLRTLNDDTFVIDLKTTEDASERAFEREMWTYKYHAQLAWYARGLNAHSPAPRRVVFVVVEKHRPYCTNVLEMDQLDLDQGDRECRRHLKTLVECRRNGQWPAYGPGMGYVGLPAWAKEE
jgi:hypothetical protein